MGTPLCFVTNNTIRNAKVFLYKFAKSNSKFVVGTVHIKHECIACKYNYFVGGGVIIKHGNVLQPQLTYSLLTLIMTFIFTMHNQDGSRLSVRIHLRQER